MDYGRWLVWPWDISWLNTFAPIAAAAIIVVMLLRRARSVWFLVISGLWPSCRSCRFHSHWSGMWYLPVIASVVLAALGWERLRTLIPNGAWQYGLVPAVALALLANSSVAVYEKGKGTPGLCGSCGCIFGRFSKNINPFDTDTLLYFIQPPFPTPNIAGMMYLRYGGNVYVYGTDRDGPGGFRRHANGFAYYFDENRVLSEQMIDREVEAVVKPGLPVQFSEPIVLEQV